MGILFLPARQGRCSGLLFCSAVRPLLLLRLRPTPTTAMAMALVATLASGAMEDTEDMALATAVLDTPPLDTLDLDTLVVTTASVRLRPSPRLMPILRSWLLWPEELWRIRIWSWIQPWILHPRILRTRIQPWLRTRLRRLLPWLLRQA